MTFLNYLFTRTCLFFASVRSATAKRRVLSALQSTRTATGCIGASYEKFLLCAADRENLAVRLKRCMRKKDKPPILNKQIDTGTLTIPDAVKQRLTRYEVEMHRTPAGQTEPVTEQVHVDWPDLTRVVYTNTYPGTLKSIFPQGTPKVAPDGSVWITAYSGEGHIAPATGRYSPYYSAEIFRSDDNCRSFHRKAHMEYEADGHRYPYQSGGFSDSDFAFFPDGSVVWFLRSTWAMSTGREWDPMYMSRSADGGQTWSDPVPFAHTGIYPRLCTLGCGAVLLCYARPGIFVQGCDDGHGLVWSDPVTVMTPDDRSGLANVPINKPLFHEWDGGCNNPTMLPLDDRSALLFYSDFYYPDEQGIKRKTILCRKLTVE